MLFDMVEQRETCIFSMVLVIKENSCEGGVGGLKGFRYVVMFLFMNAVSIQSMLILQEKQI